MILLRTSGTPMWFTHSVYIITSFLCKSTWTLIWDLVTSQRPSHCYSLGPWESIYVPDSYQMLPPLIRVNRNPPYRPQYTDIKVMILLRNSGTPRCIYSLCICHYLIPCTYILILIWDVVTSQRHLAFLRDRKG